MSAGAEPPRPPQGTEVPIRPGLLVAVLWQDAQGNPDWLVEDAARRWAERPPTYMCTVGFVVRDDDEAIVVAGSCASDAALSDQTKVPRGIVVKVYPLDTGGTPTKVA